MELCGVCRLKPAVYHLTIGTFMKYKDVCEDCLWPEMKKKGVKLKIDFPPGAWRGLSRYSSLRVTIAVSASS